MNTNYPRKARMEMDDACFNYEKSETRIDFLQCLESDLCFSILSFLDDPADIVRVSAVSRIWRQFAIESGLAKEWCLKVVPQLSRIAGVVIASRGTTNSAEFETSTAIKTERDHTVYAALLEAITKSKVNRHNCIGYAVCASSTHIFPRESIRNTMRFSSSTDYWSSKGHSKPDVPETLIYKLRAGLWLITEIDIQPCRGAYVERIYSAQSVRFRLGHPKSANEISRDPESFPLANPVDDKFVWTYISPEFPMKQESVLQRFKLPEGAVCLGGYVQIELLGRVERQASDGLFYICLSHVRVLGRPLYPAFEMEIVEPSREMWLRYYPQFHSSIMKNYIMNEVMEEMLGDRMRLMESLLPLIRRRFPIDIPGLGGGRQRR